MSFKIKTGTPIGEAQLETIKWCEDQLNALLARYFNDKYRIQKGLRVSFRIRLDLKLSETVKADIDSLEPETEERFNQAVDEAKKQLNLKEDLSGLNKE